MGDISSRIVGKPLQPTNRLAKLLSETVHDVYGMSPNADRLSLLPAPDVAPGGGPNWSSWTAPQWLYDAAKATVMPGHVAQGGAYTPEDVTDMAMTLGAAAAPVGMATVPGGALGMGFSPKATQSQIKKYAEKLGLNVSEDASNQSSSRYLNIGAEPPDWTYEPNVVFKGGEYIDPTGRIWKEPDPVKVRIATHDLPSRYYEPNTIDIGPHGSGHAKWKESPLFEKLNNMAKGYKP